MIQRCARACLFPLVLLVLVVFLAAGCGALGSWVAPESNRLIVNRTPSSDYDAIYPRYAELCGVGQYRRADGSEGGVPGHAVIYLKGACLDPDSSQPRLVPCEKTATTWDDPEHGVGLSVNGSFENASWVATPGMDLFFFGNLRPDDVLDRDRRDRTLQAELDAGVFRGVTWRDRSGRSPRDLVAERSLGSDFALTFGSSVSCARVPITAAMLAKIIDFLNGLNREYAAGAAHYDWSGIHENSAYVLHNSLAAAGVWDPVPVGGFGSRPVPADQLIDLAQRVAEFPLEDPQAIREDPAARRSLEQEDWLPARHGALVRTWYVHQKNKLFEPKLRLFALRGVGTGGKYELLKELGEAPQYTDPGAGLVFFEERYNRILNGGALYDPDEDRAWWTRYIEYIERQLADVRAKLEAVRSAQEASRK